MQKPEPGHHEYDNERDMDRFWAALKPKNEPSRQWWFLPVLLVLIVISIPWYRSAGVIGKMVFGLPLWVWLTLGCSVGISVLTAIGALYFWRDGEED